MLTVNYVDDDDELMRIYDRAGVTGANTSGINAVLFDDDEGVGVCKMVLRDEGILIVSFDVAKDKAEDPSVSDFFFRTILFKLSMSEVNILIAPDDRLEKFGFNIEKKKIDLNSPIKTIGLHEVEIKLFQGVSTKIKVDVVSE